MQAGGSAIDPLKLIQRIKNGLEIPGLRDALIKILTDFTVQISLLEGCGRILESDCSRIGSQLLKGQQSGFFQSGTCRHIRILYHYSHERNEAESKCDLCGLDLYDGSKVVAILFLCRHVVHQHCVDLIDADDLPPPPDSTLSETGLRTMSMEEYITERIDYATLLKSKMTKGCPVHTQDNQSK